MELRETYQVNEIFTSVQGEGVYTGTLATFIRLQGCTVGCPWCDSGPLADLPTWEVLEAEGTEEEIEAFRVRTTNGLTRNTWTSGGTKMTTDEIMNNVFASHVIVTGGEPTLYDLDGLFVPLTEKGCFVQLETSGQNRLRGSLKPDWITWSPKKPLGWDAPFEIKMYADEVKWVVDDDLKQNHNVVLALWKYMLEKRANNLPFFVLMPEGSPPRKENIEVCLDWLHGVDEAFQPFWRYGDRLQYSLGVR